MYFPFWASLRSHFPESKLDICIIQEQSSVLCETCSLHRQSKGSSSPENSGLLLQRLAGTRRWHQWLWQGWLPWGEKGQEPRATLEPLEPALGSVWSGSEDKVMMQWPRQLNERINFWVWNQVWHLAKYNYTKWKWDRWSWVRILFWCEAFCSAAFTSPQFRFREANCRGWENMLALEWLGGCLTGLPKD